MGDDTWLSVFPSTFSQNLTFPFDSFNVEDLHSVDNGILSHLFPLLSSDHPHPKFDFLIAHFLGVDHIGHRLGPDNPTMRSKLLSLNAILKRTIDNLPPQTLLIVLGDHGMDSSGDHGGDGVLETSSGLWIYSKHFPLFNSTRTMPPELQEYRTFPGSTVKSRAIEQIDLVPSLALLLGLPIPYNNLGSVIPELFWLDRQGKHLELALSLNAEQIMTFLRTYRDSPLGSELDDFWPSLSSSYHYATQNTSTTFTQEQKLVALQSFTRSALKACRSIWAQFNPTLMCFGLLVLSACLVASYSLYTNYAAKHERDKWLASLIRFTAVYTFLGSLFGVAAHILIRLFPIPFSGGITLTHLLIFSTSLSSSLSIILFSPLPSLPLPSLNSLTSFLPLLHSLSFFSNSYTFWEDRILPFLLLTSLLPYLLLALSPSTSHPHRTKMLTHLLLFALCTRLMAISTVCREEQQPYCHVTFFASRSVPEPPRLVLYLILPVALVLPTVVSRFFVVEKRRHWSIDVFFEWVLRPSLAAGTMFWIVEWVDSAGFFTGDVGGAGAGAGANGSNGNNNNALVDEWTRLLRHARTRIAWCAILWLVSAGTVCWWFCPSTPKKDQEERDGKKADDDDDDDDNRLATRFLILHSITFGIIWVCTQLTGQAVLALGTIALLSYLSLLSTARSAESSHPKRKRRITHPTPSPTPLALLALLTFYSTGHQAAFSSIQWKAGFVLTENVHAAPPSAAPPSIPDAMDWSSSSSLLGNAWDRLSSLNITYPLSGLTVLLNSVGGVALFGGFGSILVGSWHATAGTGTGTGTHTTRVVLSALSTQTYFLLLLLGSSIGAAVLRRHLMVWKVFAPRFMVGVLELVVVDLGVFLGAFLVSVRGRG